MPIPETVLICPRNDEESLQIIKIAKAFGIPVLESEQPHGAKLSKEEHLLARILEVNPDVSQVVIVEIPGPDEEAELQKQGFDVHIIDHHRYDALDRMKEQSSLEQFLTHFHISKEALQEKSFDPLLVRAVGAIDRGFLWELKNEGITGDDRARAIEYYRSLTKELGGERREREEVLAKQVWEKREEIDSVLVLTSDDDQTSIRDALSFLVAEAYPDEPPQTIIQQGNRRVYVQESPYAKNLHDRFGGFTFGRDACWGKLSDEGDLPTIQELLAIITT